MSKHDWIKPGADAVILQDSRRAALVARPVTIDRVLKRDVVLSDGTRFNLQRTELTGGAGLRDNRGGAWSEPNILVPADDLRVAKVRAAMRLNRVRSDALSAVDDYRRGNASAQDVADAWSRLAEVEADA